MPWVFLASCCVFKAQGIIATVKNLPKSKFVVLVLVILLLILEIHSNMVVMNYYMLCIITW